MSSISRVLLGARRAVAAGAARIGKSPPFRMSLVRVQMLQTSSASFAEASPSAVELKQAAEEDILRRELLAASTTTDLLEFIETHHKALKPAHLVMAFEMLDCKIEAGDVTTQMITESPSIELLADRTLHQMRFFDIGQCLTLLKAACAMKLAPDTALVMGICQMLRSSMNHLSISQLTFLNFLISRFENPNVLLLALKTAIPMIFQTACPTQLDVTNKEDCFNKLIFALYTGCDASTVKYIASALCGVGPDLSSAQAIRLIRAVNTSKERHHLRVSYSDIAPLKDLIDECMETTAATLTSLNNATALSLLQCIKLMGMPADLHKLLWRKARDHKWAIDSIARIVRHSSSQRYFTPSFATYARDMIIQQEDRVLSDDGACLATLSRLMALLAFQQTQLPPAPVIAAQTVIEFDPATKKALEILGNATDKALRMSTSKVKFLTYLRNLALTRIFPEKQLDLLFSESYQMSLVENDNSEQLLKLLDIEQFVRLHLKEKRPAAYEILPKVREVLVKILEESQFDNDAMHKQLVEALGGEAFVVRKFISSLGTRADFVVATGADGNVIPVCDGGSGKMKSPEQLPASDCKVASFVVGNDNGFCVDATWMPSLNLLVNSELLRLQNLNPIITNIRDWEKVHDKKAWIRQKLTERLREAPSYSSMKLDTGTVSYSK